MKRKLIIFIFAVFCVQCIKAENVQIKKILLENIEKLEQKTAQFKEEVFQAYFEEQEVEGDSAYSKILLAFWENLRESEIKTISHYMGKNLSITLEDLKKEIVNTGNQIFLEDLQKVMIVIEKYNFLPYYNFNFSQFFLFEKCSFVIGNRLSFLSFSEVFGISFYEKEKLKVILKKIQKIRCLRSSTNLDSHYEENSSTFILNYKRHKTNSWNFNPKNGKLGFHVSIKIETENVNDLKNKIYSHILSWE